MWSKFVTPLRVLRTYSNFSAFVQPRANVVESIDGALRSDGHCFLVVGTEKLVTLVGRGGMPTVFSEVENYTFHEYIVYIKNSSQRWHAIVSLKNNVLFVFIFCTIHLWCLCRSSLDTGRVFSKCKFSLWLVTLP